MKIARNKLHFLTIFILILSISIEINIIYENIVELIPHNFFIDSLNTVFFKIFKYIPSCEHSVNLSKNIFIQITIATSDPEDHKLYLYEELSDIMQNENEEFINFKESYRNFTYDLPINLKCKKEYFFVFYAFSNNNINEDYKIGPFAYQIVILNEETDIINLSPSLSDHYSFSQLPNKERKFLYSHHETKYALISSENDGKIRIIENDNLIYENENIYISKVIEFKKNSNYTILYNNLPKYSSLINFQFFNEQKYLKHDFNNGPLIVYQNNDNFYFEIDISNYKIGDNIIFFTSKSFSLEIGYQFKSVFKEKSLIYISCDSNFISIKKIRDDSSLIIYFYQITYPFIAVSLIKAKEIKSDYESTINGPKFFLIDYILLNGINSIGIESTIPFYLY